MIIRNIFTAKMFILSALIFALFATIASAKNKGTYTVLAPAVIRPNRDYSVVVSALDNVTPLRLGVEVSGNLTPPAGNSGRGGAIQPVGGTDVFKSRQEALLQPDTSQLLKFQLGDLNSGDYHLSVSGSGGGIPEFRNITALRFEPKSHSVFVETDRAIYRPGQTVQFRIIVVNPSLRPSVTGAIDVRIQDGAGTTVKRYLRVFTNKGVFTEQIQLALEPVLGQWAISVSVFGQEYRGHFKVYDFVEPKFEVTIDMPEQLSLQDGVLPLTVHAHYSYGRPVKGEVTLQITPRYKYEYLQAPYDAPVSIVRPIQASASFNVSFTDDLQLKGDYARTLSITAYVQEDLTERVQNITGLCTVYRYPYRIDFHRSSNTFKAGLKYTAYLRVTYHDGSPVTSGQVTVRHAFVRDETAFVSSTHDISPQGQVTLTVHPPVSGPSYTLALEAEYGGLKQWLGEIPQARSPSNTFLQATLVTENPMVGEEVVIGLNSTQSLVYFVYTVLGRGDVIHSATLQAHQGNTHTFRFIASVSMFPRARVIIHWVREDGELVADSLHFQVARSDRDKVSLSVTPVSVDLSAGDLVRISVSARPNSIIGLAAIDTASLDVFGSQYRMDKSDIMNELESYDSGAFEYTDTSVLRFRSGTRRNRNGNYIGETEDDEDSGRGKRSVVSGKVKQSSSMPKKSSSVPKKSKKPSLSETLKESYSSSTSVHDQRRRARRGLVRSDISWYGTSTAHDVYHNAGVVVMTNADVFRAAALVEGSYLGGPGPIDGRGWDPSSLPPAHNGPFGRVPLQHRTGATTLRPDLGPGLEYRPSPRPPLAGPYAFSHLPPPPDTRPRLHLSRPLPDTWLFAHRSTGLNGIVSWQERLPPSPVGGGSYRLTAFAIDDFDGLNMAQETVTVTSHRPFYCTIRLPAAVKRGEALAVELVVFNNRAAPVTVTVTLDNGLGHYLFPDFHTNKLDQSSPASALSRTITVPPTGGRAPLSFMVVPQTVGDVPVTVRLTGDSLTEEYVATETLRVLLEGSRVSTVRSLYLTDSESTYEMNVTTPRNIVADSLKITLSATGNVLGGLLSTPLSPLNDLPSGGGEQKTARIVPTVTLLDQLKARGQLSRALLERAAQSLEGQLQALLTHRQTDGSFAVFSEYRPSSGSTWLTAFVAKTLRHVGRYIDVPRTVITDALAWLVRRQAGDGAFYEPDNVLNTFNNVDDVDVIGSQVTNNNVDNNVAENPTTLEEGEQKITTSDNVGNKRTSPIALTAYVLLAILEVEDYSSAAVRNAGNRALEYLVQQLQGGLDGGSVYSLSLAAHALHVANHPYRDTAFYMMEAAATVQGDSKYWGGNLEDTSPSTEDHPLVDSFTVEQTSYALLTYANRSLPLEDLAPVVRWLLSYRNTLGGFSSSQDTAVGVAALGAVSALGAATPPQQGVIVRAVYGERGHRFTITRANTDVLQSIELPADTRTVSISSPSGPGLLPAIVKLVYSYNVRVTAPRPGFSLDPQLDRTTNENKLRLTACTGLINNPAHSRNGPSVSSNLAVMEVELPSGYVIDSDALPGLYDYPGVRRVERLQYPPITGDNPPMSGSGLRERGVAVYFDRITAREVCPTVTASRINRVASQKPAVIKVYDIYDMTRQSRQFYSSLPASLCDICDIGECDTAQCDRQISQLNRQRQSPAELASYPATVEETSDASVPRAVSWVTVCLLVLVRHI